MKLITIIALLYLCVAVSGQNLIIPGQTPAKPYKIIGGENTVYVDNLSSINMFRGGVRYYNPATYTFDARSLYIFAAMDTVPVDSVKYALDAAIKSIPISTWNKLDFLHIEGLNTAYNGLLNLVDTGNYKLTIVGNPVWSKYGGYKGDGNDRLRTGYTIDGNGKYKQDNASMGVYIMDNVEESVGDMGLNATDDSYIRSRYATNNMTFRFNDATNTGVAGGILTSQGFSVVSRPQSGSKRIFKNGKYLLLTESVVASTGLPGGECLILAESTSLHSTKKVGADFLGAGLSDGEVKIISEAINGFFDTLNVNAWTSQYDVAFLGDKESQGSKSSSDTVDRAILNLHPKYIIGVGDYADAKAGDSIRKELYLLNTYSGAYDKIYSVVGNHCRDNDTTGGQFKRFFNTDKTYYSRVIENTEFFFVDCYLDSAGVDWMNATQAQQKPDTSWWQNTVQGKWLIQELNNSTAKFKIIVYHQPTWVSNYNLNTMPGFAWNWHGYGVDVIINGHVHFYERLLIDTGTGNVPVINVGTSGAAQLTIGDAAEGSMVRINNTTDADFAKGMILTLNINDDTLVFNLHAVKVGGATVADKDTLTITK